MAKFEGCFLGEFGGRIFDFLVGGGMISLGRFWLVSFGEKSWLSSSFSLLGFFTENIRRVNLTLR